MLGSLKSKLKGMRRNLFQLVGFNHRCGRCHLAGPRTTGFMLPSGGAISSDWSGFSVFVVQGSGFRARTFGLAGFFLRFF